jgi:predicted DNA-binding transcriptional regulator YafY
MHPQSTPVRTVAMRDGYLLPASVNQRTDLNELPLAMLAYHRQNGGKVAFDTVSCVFDAIADSSAVVTLYADGKGELAARVLWPDTVTLTKDDNIVCRAYCTMRREWRTFRLDRMVTCHALTTPDDVAGAA